MPQTLSLSAAKPEDIFLAANLLRAGRTVAFATETVYGLGANALSAAAVEEIFTAKQRPSWDPLIVRVHHLRQLAAITRIPDHLQERVERLAGAFWPGPLTLLLPRSPAIPDAVTAGRSLVGVRIPSHRAAQYLLEAAQIPVAAPSANSFGHTSPTTAAHVLADLGGRIAAVLDAGPTTLGIESTVLDPCRTPMVLYRPGAVTAEQLQAATGVAVQIFAPGANALAPEGQPSPGTSLRHYAPRGRLILTEGNPAALLAALRSALVAASRSAHPSTTGVLLPSFWPTDSRAIIEPWADWRDPNALAATLYAALRSIDDRGAETIFCPKPAPGGLADAILDRLQKAAR